MLSYFIRRLLAMIPVFFCVALLSFAVVALFPGDFYSRLLAGMMFSGKSYTQAHAMVDAVRMAEGMDRAWFVQFWVWLKGIILHGDFGVPITYLFQSHTGLTWTLILTTSAAIWSWVLGMLVGIVCAVRRGTWLDNALSMYTYAGISFPPYVLGTLFYVLCFTLVNTHIRGPGIWGPVGYELIGKPLTWHKVGSHILHMIPAWFIIGLPMFAMVARHLRGTLSGVLRENYITVARSKGISQVRLVLRHALRNALNPLVSLSGILLPTLITGSILVGPILGFPTFGQFLLDAIRNEQQQVITASLMMYALFLFIGNFAADMMLLVLDPRIRYD